MAILGVGLRRMMKINRAAICAISLMSCGVSLGIDLTFDTSTYPTGPGGVRVPVADMNNDGISRSYCSRRGPRPGYIHPARFRKWIFRPRMGYSMYFFSTQLDIADFTGDDKPDVVVSCYQNPEVLIYPVWEMAHLANRSSFLRCSRAGVF